MAHYRLALVIGNHYAKAMGIFREYARAYDVTADRIIFVSHPDQLRGFELEEGDLVYKDPRYIMTESMATMVKARMRGKGDPVIIE